MFFFVFFYCLIYVNKYIDVVISHYKSMEKQYFLNNWNGSQQTKPIFTQFSVKFRFGTCTRTLSDGMEIIKRDNER